LSHLYIKRIFYQDRLGTNIGKAQKIPFFLRVMHGREPCEKKRKRPSFFLPFFLSSESTIVAYTQSALIYLAHASSFLSVGGNVVAQRSAAAVSDLCCCACSLNNAMQTETSTGSCGGYGAGQTAALPTSRQRLG
jgi:hypothetical protein